MRITLAPVGTASDVLPMLALAKALHAKGHVVTLCAAEEFRATIYNVSFPLFSNGKSYRDFLEAEGTDDDPSSELAKTISRDMAMHFVALRDATRHADVLVGSRLQIAGVSLAEQLKIPYLYFTSSPGTIDYDQYPIFGVPQDRLQKRRSRRLKDWGQLVLSSLNRERKLSHLPDVKNLFEHLYRSGETILALDPTIAPVKPAALQHVTGFCYFEDVVDVDEQLTAFLNEGAPPVYIAPFRTRDPLQLRALCEELVRKGHRVVVGYGWPVTDVPPGCIVSQSFSYAQLFPNMAVIIHGGAADVAAHAVRAHVPQVIAPYTAEQFYWAQKISTAGAGPVPVSSRETSQILSSMEQAMKMVEQVKGLEVSARNGAEAAAIIVEHVAEKKRAVS
jgi:UDP:flavonoid glycosyltransferase YjiC (YdhE family)